MSRASARRSYFKPSIRSPGQVPTLRVRALHRIRHRTYGHTPDDVRTFNQPASTAQRIASALRREGLPRRLTTSAGQRGPHIARRNSARNGAQRENDGRRAPLVASPRRAPPACQSAPRPRADPLRASDAYLDQAPPRPSPRRRDCTCTRRNPVTVLPTTAVGQRSARPGRPRLRGGLCSTAPGSTGSATRDMQL